MHALAIALLSALAVDFGFRAGFINDVVAYLVTAYTALLVVVLAGRSGSPHWSRRVVWRLPMALVVSVATVFSTRSWALFELPWSDFATSGYSPYFVLGVVGGLLGGVLELLPKLSKQATASTVQASADRGLNGQPPGG